MGVWCGTGELSLEDMTRDWGSLSGDMLAAALLIPGYMMDIPPGYQHFSRMGM